MTRREDRISMHLLTASAALHPRSHPCAMVALIAVAAMGGSGTLSAAEPAAPRLTARYADAQQPDISGLWVVTGAFYFSPDKTTPKLLGEYKDLFAHRKQEFDAGVAVDDVTADCLPAGMPHLLVVP